MLPAWGHFVLVSTLSIGLRHYKHKNIQRCAINNGLTTDYLALERGVRQGHPLSPYLFVVVVETLAIAIRQNTAIKGILIGKEEAKLLQYADDTTAVLSDRDSVHALFNLLDVFRKLSGLKINTSKTEGIQGVCSLRNSKSKPFGIKIMEKLPTSLTEVLWRSLFILLQLRY